MQTVGQIIANNRRKLKLTQQQLAEVMNGRGIKVKHKSISAWEKDTSEPSVETFLAMCQIFEIPDVMEEYLGHNPFKQSDPASALNEEGRKKLREYLDLLLASHLYDKPAAEVIPFERRKIKLFREMASAGTGNFLDGEEYEWYEAGIEVPAEADFGVRLSGDSMEPRFVNHQVVWVHQQDTLANGEIGIFCLNGSAYCKKLQDDADGAFLISLNPQYPPMKIHDADSLKIFGRVVG
ncbi:MAG: helix-turn-helix domain-containing protein [Lachnospiraceae bacterium]|nr:helix-turn-helix domain-containing protein [Lachnospiraceae bacterium]